MRALVIAVVIAVLVLGALFGALNSQVIDYDFGFAQLQVSKGAALLIALLLGWLLGGALCWAGSGSAQRRRFASHRSSARKA